MKAQRTSAKGVQPVYRQVDPAVFILKIVSLCYIIKLTGEPTLDTA